MLITALFAKNFTKLILFFNKIITYEMYMPFYHLEDNFYFYRDNTNISIIFSKVIS